MEHWASTCWYVILHCPGSVVEMALAPVLTSQSTSTILDLWPTSKLPVTTLTQHTVKFWLHVPTNRFLFLQGSDQLLNHNVTVPTGFWTIVLKDVEDQVYVRNTLGKIYSRFEVPIGASYACGNNYHNIFTLTQGNETIGIKFSGLQVHYCWCVCVHTLLCYMYNLCHLYNSGNLHAIVCICK